MSRLTSWLAPTVTVRAHCDVPCGIYDPAQAQLAAKTVARMVELIGQIDAGSTAPADRNKFIRCVTVKEQHAELVKHEVQVIWSDYFKPCLLYTSDAADEEDSVDLGGRRIIKKKK